MYGMKKTTIYLPEELKAELERLAGEVGKSEAELIRDAIKQLVRNATPPKPRLPLFESGDPTLAERVDKELAGGFGQR